MRRTRSATRSNAARSRAVRNIVGSVHASTASRERAAAARPQPSAARGRAATRRRRPPPRGTTRRRTAGARRPRRRAAVVERDQRRPVHLAEDEAARAVDRIDHPRVARRALAPAELLAADAVIGVRALDPRADHFLGRTIGDGHRVVAACAALVGDVEAPRGNAAGSPCRRRAPCRRRIREMRRCACVAIRFVLSARADVSSHARRARFLARAPPPWPPRARRATRPHDRVARARSPCRRACRSSGRKRRPCASARAQENDMKPADRAIRWRESTTAARSMARRRAPTSVASSIQAGSIAWPAGTAASTSASTSLPIVTSPGGVTALNVPVDPRRREVEHPLGQVACVDELQRARRRRGHDAPRAPRLPSASGVQEPRDPVREAIGRIVRARR